MRHGAGRERERAGFSALQRAEIAEIGAPVVGGADPGARVSVLFNEPKLLKSSRRRRRHRSRRTVSVLFNEPKLLKLLLLTCNISLATISFSALQRAEIAEMSIE